MAAPFLAEVRMFACNFAPFRWALCDGQLMAISQNAALFSLLGVNFGGDGRSTFGLPNFQGAAPVCAGQGAGLSIYDVGQVGGDENITLQTQETAPHSHSLQGNAAPALATTADPTNAVYSGGQWVQPPNSGNVPAYTAQAPDTTLAAAAITPAGGTAGGGALPHNNLMPYLTINFCIALDGMFPPRG
jgi:microcystin-dependent protein